MFVSRLALLFVALSAVTSALAAEPRVYTGEEIEALVSPAALAQLKRRLAPANEKSTSGNRSTLLKTLASQQANDPASEFLLHKTVLDLAASAPTDATLKIIEQLATRQNQVFVLLGEGGHADVPVPAFDVAAAARFKLSQWAKSATYLRYSDALERGVFSLANYSSLTPDQRRGVNQAIDQANRSQLQAARQELIAALDAGIPVIDLAADTALKLSDKILFTRALDKDAAGNLNKQVAQVAANFAAADGLEILKRAAQNHRLESGALLQLANLDVSAKSSAIDFLMGKLPNKSSTGSAAAALARFKDSSVNNTLGGMLFNADDVTRRGAALALHFEGSIQSSTILRNFLDSSSGNANLKRDIAKWFND